MEVTLNNINELYNYNNITEYINVFINNDKTNNNVYRYKVYKVVSSKPNYQLYTVESGIFNLAYSYIPNHMKFIIINNTTLVKIFNNTTNDNQIKISTKFLIQNDKNNDEDTADILYDKNNDEDTADTIYDE